MRRFHWALIAVFFAVLACPLVESWARWLPQTELAGAVARATPVPLSFESYSSGRFQRAFEAWFEARLDLRPLLVRADNELNLRVFRGFNPGTNTALVLGKHGFIFEREYVDALNRRNLVPVAELAQKVQRLKLLQDYLDSHGSTLLLVISPSKALSYPENLERRYVDRRWPDVPTNYEQFVPLLERAGIHVLDAQEQLFASKQLGGPAWFTNTGTHWNEPASCQIAAQIADFVRRQSAPTTPRLRCEAPTWESEPSGTDRDLLDLANLLFPKQFYRPTPKVASRVVSVRGEHERPSVLFVGSSFVWAIWNRWQRLGSRKTAFYYYYSSESSLSGVRNRPLDHSRIDFPHQVFGRTAVVIEINAAVVDQVGFGFLEDAEKAIRSEP